MKLQTQDQTSRRAFLLGSAALGTGMVLAGKRAQAAQHWLELRGRSVIVGVERDLT